MLGDQEPHNTVDADPRKQDTHAGEHRQQDRSESRPLRQPADSHGHALDGHRNCRINGRGFRTNPLPSQQESAEREEKRGHSECLQQHVGKIGADIACEIFGARATRRGIPRRIVGAIGNETEEDQESERKEHESHDLVQAFGLSGR